MTRLPFWSDDFDVDLLKVIPDLSELLGEHRETTLFTHGHATFGRLNHPACWNTHAGLAAFFGFTDAAKPAAYHCDHPLVACTFEEAVRDCWVHDFVMIVENRMVLDGKRFWNDFQPIMWHLRSRRPLSDVDLNRHIRNVRERIEVACIRLDAIRRVMA